MKKEITHLGKNFTTTNYVDVSKKEGNSIREHFYDKPDISIVRKEIKKLMGGGVMSPNIYNYYFYELMASCTLKGHKWSINEFIQSDELLGYTLGKIKNFPDIFDSDNVIKNIKAVFRLGPSGTAAKLSNFPYKTMKNILDNYNVNNNYYDYSCGWGVRLSASMANSVNYFGTDPNFKLVDNLNDLSKEFKNQGSNSTVDIRNIGSEHYIESWENKIGLAFSSPPYYDVEDYGYSTQSIEVNDTYEKWLNNYWKGTVENINKYLVNDGYFLLNTKNNKEHQLLDDMTEIILGFGFKHIEDFELKNINRIILITNDKNTNEIIRVFKKETSVEDVSYRANHSTDLLF